MTLEQSLSELRRLGLHLDPSDAAAAAERRRVRLNTRTYPLMRALGFQLLLAVVVAHNAVVFDRVAWGPVLALMLVTEAYVVLSWIALRRWFLTVPPVWGWDLSDLAFIADLFLWAWAIHITGGPLSLLWIVPLLRVADHRDASKVWVFAHLAPLVYLAAALWPPRPPDVPLGGDLLKAAFLYIAGMYIAWTGMPARWLREQREAALSAAAGLLARLTERTQRLDEARRSRSAVLQETRGGVRMSLVEIVGFSGFLLRSGGPRSAAHQKYLERIHDEGRSALRALDALPDRAVAPTWPLVSLSGLLQTAAAEEAAQGQGWREAAILAMPYGDIEVRADASRLRALLRHLLAAGRHFQGGPPHVELRVEPGTGLPDAVVMRSSARVAAGGPGGPGGAADLFNPFSQAVAGDSREMTARLELSLARSIGESLGYELAATEDENGTQVTLQLR